MAFVHERTTLTLTWLDFYGLCREATMDPFSTQQFMDGGGAVLQGSTEGPTVIEASTQEMAALAQAQNEANQAGTDFAGDALMAIGAGIVTIAGSSVVGAVVGIVIAAIGAIVKYLARLFYVECDKRHCTGYERNTNARRRYYRNRQKAIVGVNPGSESYWETKDNCSCEYYGHTCSFIRYLHDGLVINGLNKKQIDEGAGGTPTNAGRLRGANGIGRGGNAGCTETWRESADYMPLDEDGNVIAKGDVSEPWKSEPGSYYSRSWKVTAILNWLQGDGILCRTMKCMEEIITNTRSLEEDSAENQKRRRGSRWYSSIVWMMNDIWRLGKTLGWDTMKALFQRANAPAAAITAIDEMKGGKTYDVEEVPFEWWPVLKHVSFWDMRAILIEMKPYIPAGKPVADPNGEPEGERARARTVVVAPMMVPIVSAIKFMPNMQPVPAKIGSRGARWPVVAFGVGAAAVGGFAIYKLIAAGDE